MRSLHTLFVAAALLAVSPVSAATLIATNFTGSAVTTGNTIGGIVWTGDSHLTGGATTTPVTAGAGTIAGAVFTSSDTADRMGAHINVQTASGYTTGAPVWTTDYTVGYNFTNAADSLSLTDITLTGYALNNSAGFQISPRVMEFSVSVLDSTGTTVLASGVLSQTIAANSSTGMAYTIALTGTTVLNGANLGGQSGSFILRVNADKPSETSGAFAAYDDLSLNGSYVSSVPEPSVYGALGAGALAGVAIVRRRKKTA